MNSKSRSVSDDANSSDLSELTDLASIVDAVELTRTVKNSSNGENGRELSKSNVHNKKRAREHDLELENMFQNRENIKGASTVRKVIPFVFFLVVTHMISLTDDPLFLS